MRATLLALSALSLVVVTGCDSSDSDDPDLDRPDFSANLSASETVPRVPDQGVSGEATFRLLDGGSRLAYTIDFEGLDLGAYDGAPLTETTDDDVNKIHIHRAAVGEAGPHVLNIFGLPVEDDDDMVVNVETGTITGVWDDGDTNADLPEEAQTRPFSEEIDALCAGRLYLNIHTAEFTDGILRGQIRAADTEACS